MMAPIDNFFRAAALWPDRAAVEIGHVDRIEQIGYASLPTWCGPWRRDCSLSTRIHKAVLAFVPIIILNICWDGWDVLRQGKFEFC